MTDRITLDERALDAAARSVGAMPSDAPRFGASRAVAVTAIRAYLAALPRTVTPSVTPPRIEAGDARTFRKHLAQMTKMAQLDVAGASAYLERDSRILALCEWRLAHPTPTPEEQ